ncbi:unnamed protein product [Ectocarpus sp. 13 AM-2016]
MGCHPQSLEMECVVTSWCILPWTASLDGHALRVECEREATFREIFTAGVGERGAPMPFLPSTGHFQPSLPNLEVLEVCLRALPAHERLRLPHALTAQLETQGDGNSAPGSTAALPAREGGAAGCARAAAAGVGGVPEPLPGSTRGGDEHAGLGGPGPAAAARATSPPLAAVGNDEGAVLDTLLGLQAATGPAAGAGAGGGVEAGAGGSWRAGGGRTATANSDGERSGAAGGGEEVDVLQSCDDDRAAGREEEVVPAEPPSSSSSSSSSLWAQAGGGSSGRRDSLGGAAALGEGVVGPGAGMDIGRDGGGTDELEDWLDGMLADA